MVTVEIFLVIANMFSGKPIRLQLYSFHGILLQSNIAQGQLSWLSCSQSEMILNSNRIKLSGQLIENI